MQIKKYIRAFFMGVGIGHMIQLCLSFYSGQAIIGVPSYLASQPSVPLALLYQAILYGGFGILGVTTFYANEKLTLFTASLLHFVMLLVYHWIVGFYLHWFRHAGQAIFSTLIFLVIYLTIWFSIYYSEKRKFEKFNQELEKQEKSSN